MSKVTRAYLIMILLVCWQLVCVSDAQTASQATSDPRALVLVQQAIFALTGGAEIVDVTLTGTASTPVGSGTRTHTATLKASGYGKSRIDLGAGHHTVIRTIDEKGHPKGMWIGSDGKHHDIMSPNLYTDAAWFFPALGYLSIVSTHRDFVAAYVGVEDHNGLSVHHLRISRVVGTISSRVPSAEVTIGTVDVFVDSTSTLPEALRFTLRGKNAAVPVEIRYSDYRRVGAMNVSFKVQRFVRQQLVLELNYSQVLVNSGASDSDFIIR